MYTYITFIHARCGYFAMRCLGFDVICLFVLMAKVRIPSLLLSEETQTEAGEPVTQRGSHGKTAVLCLETHDPGAEEALR